MSRHDNIYRVSYLCDNLVEILLRIVAHSTHSRRNNAIRDGVTDESPYAKKVTRVILLYIRIQYVGSMRGVISFSGPVRRISRIRDDVLMYVCTYYGEVGYARFGQRMRVRFTLELSDNRAANLTLETS
jgi:hypothetical protein